MDVSSTKVKNHVSSSDEDDFFNASEPGDFITLSHLNNKSSVLCPETQNITSQYLILQQLDAHQRMISRAKGVVDTSKPKSLQSYISITDRRKKRLWQKNRPQSQLSVRNDYSDECSVPSTSRSQLNESKQDENESLRASSVNKAIQAGIPLSNSRSVIADKISWYLEALNHGELFSQPFINANSLHSGSKQLKNVPKTRRNKTSGDLMELHREQFVLPKKPFYPRILVNNNAKSKVKDMRCYNPPSRIRRKKISGSHSSDTFESYDEDEDNEVASDCKAEFQPINQTASSAEEDTQVNRKFIPNRHFSYEDSLHTHGSQYDYRNSSKLNENEEEKYLNFLSKVTEDILRSGVYSDRAIQRAFDFHMQFYQNDSNQEKLQSLLEQILDGLKISNDESEDIVYKRYNLHIPTQVNTPPEKDHYGSAGSAAVSTDGDGENEAGLQSQTVTDSAENESESKYS